MLNAIFVAGLQGVDNLTMEDLAIATPIVLVVGVALIYWMNRAYKKDQLK